MHNKSKLIIFEGVDRSGKTSIAKELAKILEIPYYKNSSERNQKRRGETKLMTQYAVPYLFDFLEQVPSDFIMDRNWPSEWCYGQVEKRDIDLEQIRLVDDWAANAFDTALIICYKTKYDEKNFIDEMTKFERVPQLVQKYHEFIKWTHVQNVLPLDTTAFDLDAQIGTILQFLDLAGMLECTQTKSK